MKKGKRDLVFSMSICLVLMLTMIPLFDASAAGKKPVIIRIADHSPAKGQRYEGFTWFAKKLEKDTAGRVKVQIYWSDALIKEKEYMEGVKKGLADAHCLMSLKAPAELPHWQAFSYFMAGPDYHKHVEMFYRMLNELPALKQDYANYNQMPIAFHILPYRVMYFAKPVTGINDMKGKTVRVNAKAYATLLKVKGALPVNLPMSECYMGMQRGAIDGLLTSYEAGYRFKFYEVAKWFLSLQYIWSGGTNVLALNKDTFNKLTPGDQKILLEDAKQLSEYFVDLCDQDLAKMAKDIKAANVKMIDVSRADTMEWIKNPAVASMPDAWAKKTGNVQFMNKVKAMMDEYM